MLKKLKSDYCYRKKFKVSEPFKLLSIYIKKLIFFFKPLAEFGFKKVFFFLNKIKTFCFISGRSRSIFTKFKLSRILLKRFSLDFFFN